MKIAFLLSTLSTGGGERVASDLLVNFPDNIEKNVLLLENKISYPYKGSILILGKNFVLALLNLRKFVKKEKPDYIISFGKIPNILNIFSGGRAILRVDNFYSKSCFGIKGNIYKLLVKKLFNRAFKIVVISKESGYDLINNFGIKSDKLKVIYNPLDTKNIKNLSKEELEEKYKDVFEKPVIINIGQIGKQKNQVHLIEAFKIVREKISDAKLVILGRGPLEKALKKRSLDIGLGNNVYFLGWQKNPFKFLANSNVFVLSSLWEGLPCSLLEAMACNVPVVSYDCSSGPREILSPESQISVKTSDIDYTKFGVLVRPENKEYLAKAIIKIIQDRELSRATTKESLKRSEDFEAQKIIKNWDFIYEKHN